MLSHPPPPPSRPESRWNLPTQPQSVALARSLTRITLAGWGVVGDRNDDAQLVVSELVTNALVHALPPIGFFLGWMGGGLRGEITDHGPITTLVPRKVTVFQTRGRGLQLVDDLADKWDVDWNLHESRKTVWFEMGVPL